MNVYIICLLICCHVVAVACLGKASKDYPRDWVRNAGLWMIAAAIFCSLLK